MKIRSCGRNFCGSAMPAEKGAPKAKAGRKATRAAEKTQPLGAVAPRSNWGTMQTWFWFAVIAVLGALFLLLTPRDVATDLLAVVNKSASDDVRQSFRLARTMADGPPVVWIRFDDRSLVALAPDHPHVVPRDALARLLDRVRAGPRPRLVFLDVAIGERMIAGLPALDAALGRWREAAAPPMAVYAGRACGTVLGAALPGSGSDEASYFAPHYARRILTLGGPSDNERDSRSGAAGASGSHTNIIWSCPVYAGLQQFEFSCATIQLGSGRSETIAIPSPARFAAAARSGQIDLAVLREQLAQATLLCRGGGEDGEFARYLTPVHLTLRDDRTDLLTTNTVGGRRLLTIRSAVDMLRDDADLESLDGAIVVIGGGSSWSPDIVPTEEGGVNGGVLVAFAMRQALTFGIDMETGRLIPILTFLIFLLSLRFLTLCLPRFRKSIMARWPRASILFFLLLQEQVLVFAIVVALIATPAAFLIDIGGAVIVAIIAAELMLLFDSLARDWGNENQSI